MQCFVAVIYRNTLNSCEHFNIGVFNDLDKAKNAFPALREGEKVVYDWEWNSYWNRYDKKVTDSSTIWDFVIEPMQMNAINKAELGCAMEKGHY